MQHSSSVVQISKCSALYICQMRIMHAPFNKNCIVNGINMICFYKQFFKDHVDIFFIVNSQTELKLVLHIY